MHYTVYMAFKNNIAFLIEVTHITKNVKNLEQKNLRHHQNFHFPSIQKQLLNILTNVFLVFFIHICLWCPYYWDTINICFVICFYPLNNIPEISAMLLIIDLKHNFQTFGCVRITWEHVRNKDSKVLHSQTLTHRSEMETKYLHLKAS